MTAWRALTLKQPWPWALCHAGMDVLNMRREFTGVIGERIGIHAGKQWDGSAICWPATAPDPYETDINGNGTTRGVMGIAGGANQFQPFGAVVAVAIITGQHRCRIWFDSLGVGFYACDTTRSEAIGARHLLNHNRDLELTCSPWAIPPVNAGYPHKPMWHWEIADVRPLTEPVPAKGRRGLWIPDAELVEAVEGQI